MVLDTIVEKLDSTCTKDIFSKPSVSKKLNGLHSRSISCPELQDMDVPLSSTIENQRNESRRRSELNGILTKDNSDAFNVRTSPFARYHVELYIQMASCGTETLRDLLDHQNQSGKVILKKRRLFRLTLKSL